MSAVIQEVLAKAGPGVALFSKSYCPYCRRAKQALGGIGVSPVVVELDERKDGGEIQAALLEMTRQRTVPNAFLNGKHIGGSDDVVAGVQSGLFDKVEREAVVQHAESSGIKKCSSADGIPCLCMDGKC